jgi:hypothetical protein
MDEMQKALDDLKALISKPLVLASPEPGRPSSYMSWPPLKSSTLPW